MKLIIRFLILTILLAGAPTVTPASFAISSAKVEPLNREQRIHTPPKQIKLKKHRKRSVKQSRGRGFRSHRPEEVFVGGLLLTGVGIALLLASDDEADGVEGMFGAVLVKLFATLAILGGAITAIVGGIWWIFDTWG